VPTPAAPAVPPAIPAAPAVAAPGTDVPVLSTVKLFNVKSFAVAPPAATQPVMVIV
jgi:hypothetical protein